MNNDFSFDESSQEEHLYRQLVGFCAALPVEPNPHSVTSTEGHWLRLNSIMDKLVALNHPDYAEFKIMAEENNWNGVRGYHVNLATIRINTQTALEKMAAEFRCGSPAYDLSEYISAGGVNVNQTANPVNNNSNYQEQRQHQEVTLSLSQAVDAALKYVRENHTEETIKQAEEVLVPLKKKNAIWSQFEKAIKFMLGLGKEAFFSFAPVFLQTALMK